MTEKFEMMKDFGDIVVKINNMPVKLGKYAQNPRITDSIVREMAVDIAYMIFFGNFRDDIKMDMESIAKVATLFKGYLLQKSDLWHSIFLMTKFNNFDSIPDKFSTNHFDVYYKLGGSQRKIEDLNDLLTVVEYNCDNL